MRIDKSFSGKRPVTTCFLTEKGRESFLNYLAILEQVVRDAASASKRGQTDLSPKPA